MARAGTLLVSLILDSTRYAAGLSQTTKKTNQTVRQIQREIKGLVNFAVGAGGLYALVRGFQAVSKAAAAQEEATLRLSQTLKNNNQFTNGNLKALEDQASALQKVTRYGDETITSAQSLLMSMGKLDAQGVRKLTPSMLDFATAMGMDVDGAAKLLGKTLGSSTNALGRYGIQVDMTKDSTARLADVIRQLREQYGGQSEIKGFTSALEQAKNAAGDLSEEIGFIITGQEGGILTAMAQTWGMIADNMKRAREEAELLKKYGPNNVPSATGVGNIGVDPTGMSYRRTASRTNMVANAQTKADIEDIWREQMNFLKQSASAPVKATAPVAQNWGATPFSQFGATGQFMTFQGRDKTAPRISGFTEQDIKSSAWWLEQAEERKRIESDLTEMLARENEERAEQAQRAADRMIMAAERFGSQWGSMLYSATNQAGNAFANIGSMFAAMAEQIAAQAAMMMVFNIATGNPKGAFAGVGGAIKDMLGFADGGYTGAGSPNAVAGYVHKGEYVVPAGVVGRYGAASIDRLISAMEGGGGGYTNQSVNNFTLSGFSGDMTLEEFAAKFNQAVRHRLIA